MLADTIRVNFQAGKGGDGYVSFGMNRKPTGGDGGRGGRIFLEGSSNVYDLTFIKHEQEFVAGNGGQGGSERKTGANGDDVIIKVPLVTTVRSAADNSIIAKITKDGERIQIARGGRGGLGNYYFRRGQVATLNKHTKGTPGDSLKTILELQLQADVVFIGFPNAGKSSMLNALTNANVKVAPYPFTTLQPHLGVIQAVVLMDLPGLIEGASTGKGLGKRFTRHAEAGRLVAHFISLESDDVVRDYKTMRAELEQISNNLAEKPELIVLTKSDTTTPEIITERIAQLREFNTNITVTSAYDMESIKALTTKIMREVAQS